MEESQDVDDMKWLRSLVLLTSLVPVASGYMFDWDLLLHVTFVPLTCLPVKGGTLKRF